MGKPLISQRRGKGSPSFKARSTWFKAKVKYRNYDDKERGVVRFEVLELVDDPARSALLMEIKYEDNSTMMLPAPEGIIIGQVMEEGYGASLTVGNILPLEKIPEGYPIFNIETVVGDGGSLARSSGAVAFVVSKTGNQVMVKLPSGKIKYFDARARAMIGNACGGGRVDKPMLKAGVGHYKAIARGHWYPTVRGVHMNANEHPFGGKQHHGDVTPKGVGAPSGVHVGSFGAKRTGRRKR
jgi:large subunit ribosomal protein L2